MRPFREQWRAGRKWRAVADELGRIGRCLNNLVGIGLDITPNSRGGFNIEARAADTSAAFASIPAISFSTRLRFGTEFPGGQDEPGWWLVLSDGYLRVRGAQPVQVGAVQQFDATEAGSLSVVRTYPTCTEPGEWSAFEYGEPPEEDDLTCVIILADVVVDETTDAHTLHRRREGDIEVYDLVTRVPIEEPEE